MATTTRPRPDHRYVSNDDATCRMFQSALLERLSHVHPVVPHVLYLPLITVMLAFALQAHQSIGQVALWFGAGALAWSLVEYVIHRFLFHPPQWIEDETRAVTASLRRNDPVLPALPTLRHKFYFLVHGVHHDYPNDSGRLVMPPSVSIPLALLFFFLFRWGMGALAPAAFAGFVAGYLVYDTTHYLTHHATGRTAFGRYQKKRHFRHHYYDSTRNFGVSSPLWDLLFGTMGRTKRVAAPVAARET